MRIKSLIDFTHKIFHRSIYHQQKTHLTKNKSLRVGQPPIIAVRPRSVTPREGLFAWMDNFAKPPLFGVPMAIA